MGTDPPPTETIPTAEAVAAGSTPGSTWQWQLRPLGAHRTRLVVRQRLTYPPSLNALWHLTEPVAFVMERRMLLGIKERAERRQRHRAAA